MARSHAVWVVWHGGLGAPVAGFTVKHELRTWLDRTSHAVEDLEIWRLDDNPGRDEEPRRVALAELRRGAAP